MHALFPGTFDPPTAGHLDLIERSARLFERVTVAVAANPEKHAFCTVEERLTLLTACTDGLANVTVAHWPGLVVEACRSWECDVLVRGVRGANDYEYESQMAGTNRAMVPELETLLLSTSPRFAHISSTLVRQIAAQGGRVSPFVPGPVFAFLRERHGAS